MDAPLGRKASRCQNVAAISENASSSDCIAMLGKPGLAGDFFLLELMVLHCVLDLGPSHLEQPSGLMHDPLASGMCPCHHSSHSRPLPHGRQEEVCTGRVAVFVKSTV